MLHQVHARNHFQALGDIKPTLENLQTAIEGENYEIEEMYPAFDTVAKLQGELESVQSIHFAIEAEKPHSLMFSEALDVVKNKAPLDIEATDIQICPNCGYTIRGGIQNNCIICGNLKGNFKLF